MDTAERRLRRRDAAVRARARRRAAGALLALALVLLAGAVLAVGASSPPRPAAGRHAGPAGARPIPSRHAAGAPPPESAESAAVERLVALGRPVYCAGPRGDEVALTFDDGPGPYTRLVLAKLRKHHVHATFFVVGRNIGLVPGATASERALGAVGDHTFHHPLLTGLAPTEAAREIGRTQRDLERSTGARVFLFRPPYGARDAAVDAIARSRGLLQVLWNVDSADSLGADYARIEHNVIAGLRPGAIILMHENHGQTVRALLSIFAALQARHLRAVSVARLLTDDPPSPAQLRAGGRACGLARGVPRSGH